MEKNKYKLKKIRALETEASEIIDTLYPISSSETIKDKLYYWNRFNDNITTLSNIVDEILLLSEELDEKED